MKVKITEEKYKLIKELISKKFRSKDIMQLIGCSSSTLSRVRCTKDYAEYRQLLIDSQTKKPEPKVQTIDIVTAKVEKIDEATLGAKEVREDIKEIKKLLNRLVWLNETMMTGKKQSKLFKH